jgi:hypothetical protein
MALAWQTPPPTRTPCRIPIWKKTLDWNEGEITERGVRLFIVQHLGQQIACARSIGVAPPWTLDPPRKD